MADPIFYENLKRKTLFIFKLYEIYLAKCHQLSINFIYLLVGTSSTEYVLLVLLWLPPDVYAQGGHIPPYNSEINLHMSGNKLNCLIDNVFLFRFLLFTVTDFRATLWCYAFDDLNKISSNHLKLKTIKLMFFC